MLQGGEIIIIALLALVLLGPKRLPEMFRKAGQWTAELRQAAREITRGLEAEVSDLKDVADELKTTRDEITRPLKDIQDEMKSVDTGQGFEWTGPKPVSGPTPEDAMRDFEKLNRTEEGDTAPDDESESQG
jgi:sec-independent protein translocase protein TatB